MLAVLPSTPQQQKGGDVDHLVNYQVEYQRNTTSTDLVSVDPSNSNVIIRQLGRCDAEHSERKIQKESPGNLLLSIECSLR